MGLKDFYTLREKKKSRLRDCNSMCNLVVWDLHLVTVRMKGGSRETSEWKRKKTRDSEDDCEFC